jgi:hypothetical protein
MYASEGQAEGYIFSFSCKGGLLLILKSRCTVLIPHYQKNIFVIKLIVAMNILFTCFLSVTTDYSSFNSSWSVNIMEHWKEDKIFNDIIESSMAHHQTLAQFLPWQKKTTQKPTEQTGIVIPT